MTPVFIAHSFAGADETPPPKPSRTPVNSTMDQSGAPVSTYIVAQSPEVLAQMLKENQARGVCPSVYTTPATPFNTLAVQFQDDEKVLTTAVVPDLPFVEHSEPQSFSESNLDSLESSDTTLSPLMSSLNLSESGHSPAPHRKSKIKEMQNLYAVSAKKLSGSSGEIYGPVAGFSQSSAIVGSLSQSPTLLANFAENPSASGPSSLSIFEANATTPESLYGPVLKFRAENKPGLVQSARSALVSHPSPVRTVQAQSMYPQNYAQQQVYTNVWASGVQKVQQFSRQDEADLVTSGMGECGRSSSLGSEERTEQVCDDVCFACFGVHCFER